MDYKPYQLRVIDEKEELDTKLTNLWSFMGSVPFKQLDMAEQIRLQRQRFVMMQYSDILRERIDHFEVTA